MLHRSAAPVALMIAGLALAGCANDALLGPNNVTTASTTPTTDPACLSLSAQIDGYRKDGVAEKIEKAATKKYKMTPADLTKADQLTKANAEFQSKCSTLPKPAITAQPAASSAGSQVATAAPIAPGSALKSTPTVTPLPAAPAAKQ